MKNEHNTNNIYAVILAALIIIVSAIYIGNIKAILGNDSIRIKGIYGITIQYSDIKEIKKIETFPLFGLKTNGINLFFMNIGDYTYTDIGPVRLFEISKEKPYLMIIDSNRKTVLGFGKKENDRIYNEIIKIITSDKVKKE